MRLKMIRLKHCRLIENYMHLDLHAKAKIKSAKWNSNQQCKNQITRSSEWLKLKWKSVFHSSTCKAFVFNPISNFSLFSVSHSLINQNLTLNLSLCFLYSQSEVSLVSTLHSIPSTIHTPFQTLAVAAVASSPQSWLHLTFHHGLSLLMLMDQLFSLKTLRYIFFLFHLSFSLF